MTPKYQLMMVVGVCGALSFLVPMADKGAVARANEQLKQADQSSRLNQTSPVRRIERDNNPKNKETGDGVSYRSYNGTQNNLADPNANASHEQLIRLTNADYSDGVSSLAGQQRPSPRDISNIVAAQLSTTQTPNQASDFLWQWGQFLDHDIDLTDGAEPAEPEPVPVPANDEYFVPNESISFNRSLYDTATGTSTSNPRQQINEITGWIDASNVYGSDEQRALALRTLDGSGQLKTSDNNLLPFNTDGLSNAGGPSSALFLAGDVRANEQVGLTAMHTLFVREHNRLAKDIQQRNPALSGEEIFQRARKIVGAQMQIITYKEFLPILLGRNALRPYRGYDDTVDASIANEFSSAAYRFGHSLLPSQILRLDNKGNEIAEGHLALKQAFFSPQRILSEGGIAPLLRGLAKQKCEALDEMVIDDVRNFLFGEPGDGGFDLVSLNIQRGRDHGLPSYNDTRATLGLERVLSFAEISSNADVQRKLAAAYISVDDIDLWVGGLSEDRVSGALVGEVFFEIIKNQFEKLRDGDRFWYENYLDASQIRALESTTLSKIIRRNTTISDELQANVFLTAQSKQLHKDIDNDSKAPRRR